VKRTARHRLKNIYIVAIEHLLGGGPYVSKFQTWPTAVHRGASLGGKSCAWYWKGLVPQPTCGYGVSTDSSPVGSTGEASGTKILFERWATCGSLLTQSYIKSDRYWLHVPIECIKH